MSFKEKSSKNGADPRSTSQKIIKRLSIPAIFASSDKKNKGRPSKVKINSKKKLENVDEHQAETIPTTASTLSVDPPQFPSAPTTPPLEEEALETTIVAETPPVKQVYSMTDLLDSSTSNSSMFDNVAELQPNIVAQSPRLAVLKKLRAITPAVKDAIKYTSDTSKKAYRPALSSLDDVTINLSQDVSQGVVSQGVGAGDESGGGISLQPPSKKPFFNDEKIEENMKKSSNAPMKTSKKSDRRITTSPSKQPKGSLWALLEGKDELSASDGKKKSRSIAGSNSSSSSALPGPNHLASPNRFNSLRQHLFEEAEKNSILSPIPAFGSTLDRHSCDDISMVSDTRLGDTQKGDSPRSSRVGRLADSRLSLEDLRPNNKKPEFASRTTSLENLRNGRSTNKEVVAVQTARAASLEKLRNGGRSTSKEAIAVPTARAASLENLRNGGRSTSKEAIAVPTARAASLENLRNGGRSTNKASISPTRTSSLDNLRNGRSITQDSKQSGSPSRVTSLDNLGNNHSTTEASFITVKPPSLDDLQVGKKTAPNFPKNLKSRRSSLPTALTKPNNLKPNLPPLFRRSTQSFVNEPLTISQVKDKTKEDEAGEVIKQAFEVSDKLNLEAKSAAVLNEELLKLKIIFQDREKDRNEQKIEIETLRKKLAQSSQMPDPVSRLTLEAMEKEMNQCKAENDRKDVVISTLQTVDAETREEMKGLRTQLGQLKLEKHHVGLNRSEAELATLETHAAVRERLEAQVQDLFEDIEQTEAELLEMKMMMEEKDKEGRQLIQWHANAVAELEHANNQIDELYQQLDQTQQENTDLNDAMEQLRDEAIAHADSMRGELNEAIKTTGDEKKLLESAISQSSQKFLLMESSNKENKAMLESKTLECLKYSEKIKDLQDEVTYVEERCKELEEGIYTLENNKKQALNEHLEILDSMKAQADSYRAAHENNSIELTVVKKQNEKLLESLKQAELSQNELINKTVEDAKVQEIKTNKAQTILENKLKNLSQEVELQKSENVLLNANMLKLEKSKEDAVGLVQQELSRYQESALEEQEKLRHELEASLEAYKTLQSEHNEMLLKMAELKSSSEVGNIEVEAARQAQETAVVEQSNLRTKLSKVTAELTSLKGKHSTLQLQVTELETSKQEEVHALTEAARRVEEATTMERTKLQSKLNKLVAELSASKAKATAEQSKVADLEVMRQEDALAAEEAARQEVAEQSKHQIKVSKLIAELNAMKTANASLSAKIDELEGSHQENLSNTEFAAKQAQEISNIEQTKQQAKISKLTKETVTLKFKNASLMTKISKLEGSKQEEAEQFAESYRQAQENAMSECSKLQNKLSKATSEVSSMKSQISTQKVKINELEVEIEEHAHKLAHESKQSEEAALSEQSKLQAKLSTMTTSLNDVQTKNNDLMMKMSILEAEKESDSQNLVNSHEAEEAAKAELNKLKNKLSSTNTNLNDLQTKNNDLLVKITELESAKEEAHNLVSSSKQTEEVALAVQNKLQSKLSAISPTLSSTQSQNKELLAKINQLEAEKEEDAINLADVSRQAQEAALSEQSKLQAKLSTTTTSLNDVQTKNNDLMMKISILEAEKEEETRKFTNSQQSEESGKIEQNKLKAKLSSATKSLNDLKTKNNELVSRISELELEKEQEAQNLTQASIQSEEAGKIEQNKLKAKLSSATKSLNDLKTKNNELVSRISELELEKEQEAQNLTQASIQSEEVGKKAQAKLKSKLAETISCLATLKQENEELHSKLEFFEAERQEEEDAIAALVKKVQEDKSTEKVQEEYSTDEEELPARAASYEEEEVYSTDEEEIPAEFSPQVIETDTEEEEEKREDEATRLSSKLPSRVLKGKSFFEEYHDSNGSDDDGEQTQDEVMSRKSEEASKLIKEKEAEVVKKSNHREGFPTIKMPSKSNFPNVLAVAVVRASELVHIDRAKTLLPCPVIKLRVFSEDHEGALQSCDWQVTKPVQSSLDPDFNQIFQFPLILNQKAKLEVLLEDQTDLKKPVFIGRHLIPLRDLSPNGTSFRRVYQLKGRDGVSRDGPRGQVDLSLCWFHDESKITSTAEIEQSTQASKKPSLKKKQQVVVRETKTDDVIPSSFQQNSRPRSNSNKTFSQKNDIDKNVEEEISVAWDVIGTFLKDRKVALEFFAKQQQSSRGGGGVGGGGNRLLNKSNFNKSLIELGTGELSETAIEQWMKIIDPLNSKQGFIDYEKFIHISNTPKGGRNDFKKRSQSIDEMSWKCSLCAKDNEMAIMFCGACGRSRGKHVSNYLDALTNSQQKKQDDDDHKVDIIPHSSSSSPGPIIEDLAIKKKTNDKNQSIEFEKDDDNEKDDDEEEEELFRVTFGAGPIGLAFNHIDHGGGCLIVTKVEEGSAALLSGVDAGDLIVEVNEEKLEMEFTEDNLFTLLTELPRPISIGFMKSNLFETVTDLDSAYSGHSDFSADEGDASDVELSPMTPMTENTQASQFFDSLVQQAALSPNTPSSSSLKSPTTAELRLSFEDSPGQVMDQPRILKAGSKAALAAHRANNAPSVTPPPVDIERGRSSSERSSGHPKSMLELMQAEK